MSINIPLSPRAQITAGDAALLGIPQGTVRVWQARGQIAPVGYSGNSPLFSVADLQRRNALREAWLEIHPSRR